MFLLPLTHEQNTARRWPWVTIGVVVLNVLLYVYSVPADRVVAEVLEVRAGTAAGYAAAHPYLEVKPPLDRLLGPAAVARRRPKTNVEKLSVELGFSEESPGDDILPEARAEEQRTLDGLVAQVSETMHELTAYRFGFAPAEGNVLGLVTYQFFHGGFLHLLGNLWFLWLVGCNVEDVWGRRVFPLFYLSAGVIAALAHKLLFWSSPAPLIGASGAVAGAMGAFLVRYARTRIRFFFLYFYRPITFHAPAYTMLPLWLVTEVWDGMVQSSVGGGSGVAHWAHVGGFVFGVGFAFWMKQSGTEARIDEAIEKTQGSEQDSRILDAGAMISSGRALEALPILEALALEQPGSIDVRLELLRAATALGDAARARAVKAELVELQLQHGALAAALDLYDELAREGAATAVPPALRLRIARHIDRLGGDARAVHEYCELYRDPDAGSVRVAAILGHAELALRQGRSAEAKALFGYALENVTDDPGLEPVIRQGLQRASAPRASLAPGAARGE